MSQFIFFEVRFPDRVFERGRKKLSASRVYFIDTLFFFNSRQNLKFSLDFSLKKSRDDRKKISNKNHSGFFSKFRFHEKCFSKVLDRGACLSGKKVNDLKKILIMKTGYDTFYFKPV